MKTKHPASDVPPYRLPPGVHCEMAWEMFLEDRKQKFKVNDILRGLAKQKAAVIREEINKLRRHLRNYEDTCMCGHERGLHNFRARTCSDMGPGIGIDCPCPKYRKRP